MRIHLEKSADGENGLMLCGKVKRRKSRFPIPIYCTRCVRRLMKELQQRGMAA